MLLLNYNACHDIVFLSILQVPVSKKHKKERFREELEERVISLLSSLFGKISNWLLICRIVLFYILFYVPFENDRAKFIMRN